MDALACRAHFPALQSDWAFLENAGGSQVPQQVVTSISAYFQRSYVQLGAGYEASLAADAVVASARQLALALLTREPDAGFTVLGGSTTTLLNSLADQWVQILAPGDVLVLATCGHESNIGCWVRAAERTGATVVWWHPGGANGEEPCPVDELERLLTQHAGRVRLVAFPHTSNLLGGVADVTSISRLAHDAGARVVVDGVAFAPHRRVDASVLQADWYVFSFYKVYGPHAAALLGLHSAWCEVRAAGAKPANHFFIIDSGYGVAGDASHPSPWYAHEPGGINHESCAALCGTRQYLAALAGSSSSDDRSFASDVATVDASFRVMEDLERPVLQLLAAFFTRSHEEGRLRLLGPRGCDAEALSSRVPTFSFVPLVGGVSCTALVRRLHASKIACRNGHMYAHRLCTHLRVEHGEWAVRVSAVHYNTVQEAQRCIDAIEEALRGQ
jgi:selenocysteine lyase/cysteine desulfurase